MPTESKYAGTVTENATGDHAWTSPENAEGMEDGNYAGASCSDVAAPDLSSTLQARDFGFALTGATAITSITVRVHRHATTNGSELTEYVEDNLARLVEAGSQIGNDLADATPWQFTTDEVKVYSAWSTMPSVANARLSTFGLDLQAALFNSGGGVTNVEAHVDAVEIEVVFDDGSETQDEPTICWFYIVPFFSGSAISQDDDMDLGDRVVGASIYHHFNTFDADKALITIAGSPTLTCYRNDGTTEDNSGLTLTVDFDGVTGFHVIKVDTSADGAFYTTGDFTVIFTAGTVDGVSLAGARILRFSLIQSPGLRPTVAGRTLDVSAGGEAGIDFANIGSPTTTLNLSGTTIKTATDVETATADIQSRIPAALGANGNMKGDVRDFNGVAGTFASGRPEVNSTHWAGTAVASATITVVVGTGGITTTSIATGAVDADALATDAVTEIATGVWALTDGIETGYTPKSIMRLVASAMFAKLSGVLAGSPVFRDILDTKNRISATTTTDGRTAVTLDAS